MPKKQKLNESDPKIIRQRQVLFGGGLMMVALLLGIAFVSYLVNWKTDYSTLDSFADKTVLAKNLLNKVGAFVSHFFIYKLFGIASFIFPLLLGYTGHLFFFDYSREKVVNHWSWSFLYIILFCVFFGFYHYDMPLLGGLVGFEVNTFLVMYLGKIGVSGLLIFSLLVILVFQWKLTPERVKHYLQSIFQKEEQPDSVPVENSLDLEMDEFVEATTAEATDIEEPSLTEEEKPDEEEVTLEIETFSEEEASINDLAQSISIGYRYRR